MTRSLSFPSFRIDVAYYADFGYAKMIVASAMVGLLVAMHNMTSGSTGSVGHDLPFGLYAGLAALVFFVVCILLARVVEQRKLSEYHVGLVQAMPWNDCGQAILDGLVEDGQPLRACHLRYIAEAHMRQVQAEGGESCDAEAAIFGRSLSMRYPSY